ncbi:hypothetical protein Q9295_16245 [Xinfangfangia sp. CPCC 101601]|uniref:Uncharacterized protein n=1 Tax=Pseudogemmobacter lacusdianii TaxID=3069608 RepID=A0ABU0W1M8_9RHOB|nr:hypothetical protein [Xinfangfangia sp. CPCC 101601]MDQ2067927.1 hypothetical protein [Xinfangfangia sp. CPCC 101601]
MPDIPSSFPIISTTVSELQSLQKTTVGQLSLRIADLMELDAGLTLVCCAEAGVRRRKAYALAQIGRAARHCGINAAAIDKVGWTKMQIIAPLLQKKGWALQLALAKATSAHRLKLYVQNKLAPDKLRVMTLYFARDDYQQLAVMLTKFGATAKGKALLDKEAALMALVKAVSGSSAG